MYCRHCGKELTDDAKFCPNCGTSTQEEVRDPFTSNEHFNAPNEVVEDKPPKVWTVFSVIGKVLGIVCLCASIIPYVNIFAMAGGIFGIVFSCLGRKAKTQATDNNCRIGLILSIIAVALSLVMIIIYFTFLLALIGGVVYYSFY